MRDAQRFAHPQRDLPPQADHGDFFLVVALGVARRALGFCAGAFRVTHEVVVLDPSAGTAPAHAGQLDLQLASVAANGRGREWFIDRGRRRGFGGARRSRRGLRRRSEGLRGGDCSRSTRRGRRHGCHGLARALRFEPDQLGADGKLVAGLSADRNDAPRDRRRHLDRRLVRHQVGDDLILFDRIARPRRTTRRPRLRRCLRRCRAPSRRGCSCQIPPDRAFIAIGEHSIRCFVRCMNPAKLSFPRTRESSDLGLCTRQ